jgi:hypothetical protein
MQHSATCRVRLLLPHTVWALHLAVLLLVGPLLVCGAQPEDIYLWTTIDPPPLLHNVPPQWLFAADCTAA